MNNYHNQPRLGGNLKFSVYPGIDITTNVANLSPTGIIVISLGLATIGFYLYLNQAKENKASKTN
jgi:hypothetical protein